MKDRHWKRIQIATKHKFDLDSPTFTLRNVMEAPLLSNKDDIEVKILEYSHLYHYTNLFCRIFVSVQ